MRKNTKRWRSCSKKRTLKDGRCGGRKELSFSPYSTTDYSRTIFKPHEYLGVLRTKKPKWLWKRLSLRLATLSNRRPDKLALAIDRLYGIRAFAPDLLRCHTYLVHTVINAFV